MEEYECKKCKNRIAKTSYSRFAGYCNKCGCKLSGTEAWFHRKIMIFYKIDNKINIISETYGISDLMFDRIFESIICIGVILVMLIVFKNSI